ncbi:MAG: winged helix-turn-helix domain-containing protein [Acidobacteriaceae bacterium]|nr:winged helix-turn-helix domain-containing protein [Acidobacteriaceae bacterium]
MPSRNPGRYSFAVFSFDSSTGDLSRNNYRLRITEQARQVLSTLLEKAGNTVTREELRLQLWPGGEFLDWDHSINKVVAQLRSTLRDSARESRLIETVPKRGYRFIAPVTFEAEAAPVEALAPEIPETSEHDEPEEPPVLVSPRAPAGKPSTEYADEKSYPVEVPPEIPVLQAQHSSLSLRRIAAYFGFAVLLGTLSALVMAHVSKRNPSEVALGIPPFETAGEASDTVAESFRMDLTSAVAELPRVQVRAAHSLTAPLRDAASIRATAKSLQLDLLLFGKLTFDGDRCVLNMEVVRGRDAVHLASFRYTGSTKELGNIRERIQRDLFDQLGLAEGNTKWRSQAATPDPQAYKDYLQARLDLSGWADAPVQKAVTEFEHAIREDPKFANAYAGIASAYVILAEHGAAPRESSYRKAGQAAQTAIELAPATAEAHAILGQVALRQDWNFNLAERELRRAVELDPNRALYRLWLSVLLADQSRFEESLNEIDLAQAADPLWAPIYRTEVFVANAAGQSPRALAAAEKLTTFMANWPLAYDQRGWTYWHAGHYVEAIADWRRMAEMENDSARMQLEDEGLEAFRRGGPSAYARVHLKAIRSGYPYKHAAMDFVPAEWYCISGDYGSALSEIDRMIAGHDPDVLQLAVNWTLLPLHDQPRFLASLVRIGINEPRPRTASKIAGREAGY